MSIGHAPALVTQFFRGAEQPGALRAIRAWTGSLFADLDEQDARISRGALASLDVKARRLKRVWVVLRK